MLGIGGTGLLSSQVSAIDFIFLLEGVDGVQGHYKVAVAGSLSANGCNIELKLVNLVVNLRLRTLPAPPSTVGRPQCLLCTQSHATAGTYPGF